MRATTHAPAPEAAPTPQPATVAPAAPATPPAKAVPPAPTGTQRLTFAKAITLGLRRALADDDKVLLMGEDIGRLGGVFRITDGLQADFGEDRVVDTPLAEAGILGTAVGLAIRGYRPVCEIQFDGFIFPAFDQITSQLSRLTLRHDGTLSMPVVIRVPYGGHIGSIEHHQESPEAYFAHTPGLRVVAPSSPLYRRAVAKSDSSTYQPLHHALGDAPLSGRFCRGLNFPLDA